LAAGPPIFAMCGPGDTVDIIRRTGSGVWAHDKTPEDMAAHLERWLDVGSIGTRRDLAEIGRYSREELGRRFVDEVERTLGSTRAAVI
jgi:hypothetical protein